MIIQIMEIQLNFKVKILKIMDIRSIVVVIEKNRLKYNKWS